MVGGKMGILQRLKSLFRRKSKAEPASTPVSIEGPPLPTGEDQESMEIRTLIEEHKLLEEERIRLRKEIEVIEMRFSGKIITAADRDTAYRMRLSRAGQISLRQVEIRNRLIELEYPIPHEWRRAIRYARA